jgi:O-antigen/teichoic acid export membrane protein
MQAWGAQLPLRASFGSIKLIIARLSVASIAPLLIFSSRFARTVILSRSLSPSAYGVVVALTTIYAILDMIDIGLDRFVMINTGPKRAAAVAVAQRIAFVRGLVAMVVIAVFAPVLATIFGADSHADIVRWLAPLPVIRSLANLRVKQVQQEYRNGPEALASIASQAGALLVLFPALALFNDERAMLVSLYVDGAVYVGVTWLILPREKVSFMDPALRREALAYGLPLIVNGAGLLVISQGDKLVVGNLFGLETLALYSLVVNLALMPLSPLGAILQNLSIAFLAGRRENVAASNFGSFVVTWTFLIISSGYAASVALLLDLLVPLIYGPHYAVSSEIKVLVALLSFSRFCRQGPTTILLVAGRTRQLAVANLIAGIGLVLGYNLGTIYHSLPAVLTGIVLGDAVATLVIFYQVRRQSPTKATITHAIFLMLPVVAICAFSLAYSGATLWMRGLVLLFATTMVSVDVVLGYRYHIARVGSLSLGAN